MALLRFKVASPAIYDVVEYRDPQTFRKIRIHPYNPRHQKDDEGRMCYLTHSAWRMFVHNFVCMGFGATVVVLKVCGATTRKFRRPGY